MNLRENSKQFQIELTFWVSNRFENSAFQTPRIRIGEFRQSKSVVKILTSGVFALPFVFDDCAVFKFVFSDDSRVAETDGFFADELILDVLDNGVDVIICLISSFLHIF